MLRHDRQIKPALVALYDIWPGNGAGLFLQPRRPEPPRATMQLEDAASHYTRGISVIQGHSTVECHYVMSTITNTVSINLATLG